MKTLLIFAAPAALYALALTPAMATPSNWGGSVLRNAAGDRRASCWCNVAAAVVSRGVAEPPSTGAA
jgi:hypothetical protein